MAVRVAKADLRTAEDASPFGAVLTIPAGKVRCLAGARIVDLRTASREDATASLATTVDGRRVLLHAVDGALSPQAAFQSILDALADAALALFPLWYDPSPGRVEESAPSSPSPDLDRRASACGASRTWLARARTRAEAGQRPLPRGFAAVETARQLGLILAPEGLCVVLALEEASGRSAGAAFLPHLAPWLADSCDWSVGLLLAGEPPASDAWDRIRHGLVRLDLMEPDDAGDAWPQTAPPGGPDGPGAPLHVPGGAGGRSVLWPVVGRPHPLSPAERKLARLLAKDERLRGLFTFNMPVRTYAGSTYLVDLLWQAGRLVVEVDGYGPHSSRAAFARDRHRDFELTATRFRVLRLTHDEIMRADTGVLSKLHTLVDTPHPEQTAAS